MKHFFETQTQSVTDRQTDRQTDRHLKIHLKQLQPNLENKKTPKQNNPPCKFTKTVPADLRGPFYNILSRVKLHHLKSCPSLRRNTRTKIVQGQTDRQTHTQTDEAVTLSSDNHLVDGQTDRPTDRPT
ncbi:hypothetical protein DPMN_076266 [Dreissena polymorpha]|uniref:Uncharacterized protein n=1 Tax=Dreissena polymorpha TaxID=45954 RepID=A0A9D4BN88_DREPO|nr:hypothetical protein DPMN_076266 [Dreissena polymorpha]